LCLQTKKKKKRSLIASPREALHMFHFLVSPSLVSKTKPNHNCQELPLPFFLSLSPPFRTQLLSDCPYLPQTQRITHTQTHKSFKNETRKHETGGRKKKKKKKKTLNATSDLRKEEPELQKTVVV
jgi:hypothetical protein